ncbi:MAG: PD40 domain-containing protein [Dehalococcoidia bacterium]|nr:PD40 domain-containing protein [Dehalococcoidia bacterium]
MSNLKLYKLMCLIGLLALSFSSLFACAAPATKYQPSYLPGLVAFASDRDDKIHIYTICPDGTDLRSLLVDNITADGTPDWSPDGQRIAFSSNQSQNYQIWSMNADGSDRRKLTDLKGRSALPKWSPDGSKIVFISQVINDVGIFDLELFAMNSDGTNVRQLTDSATREKHEESAFEAAGHAHSHTADWNSAPTWSPDSSKILFASNRDRDAVTPILYTMNADGSDQKKFGLFVDVDGSEPDWSPVTNKIVWVRGTAAKGDIWVMDASSPFPLITARKLTDNIDDNRNPAWSPDGTQIAFTSDTSGNTDIYIMNADGSNIRRLIYGEFNNMNPAWR